MDESLLLKGLIAGDKQQFSRLFDRYWKELYSYVLRLVNDKEESIDIVQETFTSLWQQRKQLVHVQSLKGYIYAVAHHKAVRFIKSSVRHQHYVDAMAGYLEQAKYSLEDEVEGNDLASFINSEIDKLPPRAREIFMLSRNEELSYKEIADKLSIAENTVRKQISFSIKHLRMRVDKVYRFGVMLLLVIRLAGLCGLLFLCL